MRPSARGVFAATWLLVVGLAAIASAQPDSPGCYLPNLHPKGFGISANRLYTMRLKNGPGSSTPDPFWSSVPDSVAQVDLAGQQWQYADSVLGINARFQLLGPNDSTNIEIEVWRGNGRIDGCDAFHIGIAAAHQIEYLLTWNCKHIANAAMRGTIEAICRSQGFTPPIICTPEELPVRSPQ